MKTIELNEQELEEVSGGASANINYSYSIDQKVIDECNMVLKIIELAGWNYCYNCPKYECLIIELPQGYPGTRDVGDTITRAEVLIRPYN